MSDFQLNNYLQSFIDNFRIIVTLPKSIEKSTVWKGDLDSGEKLDCKILQMCYLGIFNKLAFSGHLPLKSYHFEIINLCFTRRRHPFTNSPPVWWHAIWKTPWLYTKIYNSNIQNILRKNAVKALKNNEISF